MAANSLTKMTAKKDRHNFVNREEPTDNIKIKEIKKEGRTIRQRSFIQSNNLKNKRHAKNNSKSLV